MLKELIGISIFSYIISLLSLLFMDIRTFAKDNFFQMLIVISVLSFVLTLKHTYL